MKQNRLKILLILMISILSPNLISAELNVKNKAELNAAEASEAKCILNRLEEIKAMDKSHLSFQDKKVLRKEVRNMRTNMNRIGNGVYLSAGAVILIVLLLILII